MSTTNDTRPEMGPTPRTDAASDFTVIYGAGPDVTLEYVPANFARELERENAELRGKLERLKAACDAFRYPLGIHLKDCDIVDRKPKFTEHAFRWEDSIRAILNEGSK